MRRRGTHHHYYPEEALRNSALVSRQRSISTDSPGGQSVPELWTTGQTTEGDQTVILVNAQATANLHKRIKAPDLDVLRRVLCPGDYVRIRPVGKGFQPHMDVRTFNIDDIFQHITANYADKGQTVGNNGAAGRQQKDKTSNDE